MRDKVVTDGIEFVLPPVRCIEIPRILCIDQCHVRRSGWKLQVGLDEVRFNVVRNQVVTTLTFGRELREVVTDDGNLFIDRLWLLLGRETAYVVDAGRRRRLRWRSWRAAGVWAAGGT